MWRPVWLLIGCCRLAFCVQQVFLRGIPVGATEKDVREALRPFGEIASVSLPRYSDGVAEALQPKHFGFGTVEFHRSGEAARALAAEVLISGQSVTVERDLTGDTGREALLQQLKKCRDKEQVGAVALIIGRPQSVREANKLIIAWGRAMETQQAIHILETMRSDGLAPECKTYSAAISAYEKVGQWQKALDLFREMQSDGVRPDVISFNAVIAACGKGQQWEYALQLLDEMPRAGVDPDATTFATAISACAKPGQWQKAIALLNQMRRLQLPPGPIAYSAAMSACRVAGQWERTIALLDEMRATGSLVPNAVQYNHAICACVDAGEHARAADCYRMGYSEGVYELVSSDAHGLRMDLHGLSSDVACVAVAELLHDLRDKYSPGDGLKIITGRGKRSRNQIAVIKARVVQMLSQPQYEALKASEAAGNPGLLVIRAAKLKAWLATAVQL